MSDTNTKKQMSSPVTQTSRGDTTDNNMDWTTKFLMSKPEVQERMIRERERQNKARREQSIGK